LMKLSVNAKGSFSGAIWFQGARSNIHGTLAVTGTYSGSILRSGTSPLSYTIKADDATPDAITGTVNDGATLTNFNADRAEFNSKTNPCPYAGRYTVVFKSSQSPDVPQGQGIGTITVSSNGALHLSGMLPEGTSISHGATLSKNGLWAFYAALYSGHGYIVGPHSFGPSGEIDGVVDWIKPSRPKDSYYPNGFQTRFTTLGSLFQPPITGQTVIKLGARTLALQDTDVQLSKTLELNSPSRFTVLNPDADKLSITISTSTGLISGKFLSNPVTGVWTALHAVILQGQDDGAGFFLENHQSGDLELSPAP